MDTSLWFRFDAANNSPVPAPYGDTFTYKRGAEWLKACALIEDWGCGRGYLKTLVPPERYRGIDGSHSPQADILADLRYYRSQVPGIFMRHVLEHNYDWQTVLQNAVASFTERMVLILFTPFSLSPKTTEICFWEPPGVPDLSLPRQEIESYFTGMYFHLEQNIPTHTAYWLEHIYYLSKDGATL